MLASVPIEIGPFTNFRFSNGCAVSFPPFDLDKEHDMNFPKSQMILTAACGMLCLALGNPRLVAEEPKGAPSIIVNGQLGVEAKQPGGHFLHLESNGTAKLVWSAAVAQSASLIGIDAVPVDDALRSHLALAEGKGVVVSTVGKDSPAANAGLQKNDVLVSVADSEIMGAEGVEKLLKERAGKPTTITLIRAGKKQTLEITPLPSPSAAKIVVRNAPGGNHYWLGLGLANADDTLRSHLGIPASEGLVVTQVDETGPAKKSGVMVNDLLLKLDGKTLTTVEAIVAQIQEIADKSVPLELLRHGKTAMLSLTPEKRNKGEVSFRTDELVLYTTFVGTKPGLGDNVELFTSVISLQNQPKPDVSTQVTNLRVKIEAILSELEALAVDLSAAQSKPAAEPEKKD